MSWSGEVLTMVRYMIWDIDSGNYTYTDDSLLGAVFMSAKLVSLDVSTTNDYTVDVETRTIDPDPSTPTSDPGFINLTALKTSANILFAEAKLESKRGIAITDGPSSINTGNRAKDVASQAKTYSDRYELYKRQYTAGRYGKGVITPTTEESLPDSFLF